MAPPKKRGIGQLHVQEGLGIENFRETSILLYFDDLQSETMIDRFNHYRKARPAFFNTDLVRSLLDYYYLEKR